MNTTPESPERDARTSPRGTLTVAQAWASVLIAGSLFFLAAWLLNPLCFVLSPLALGW